jgi:hypothetical protein
MKRFIFVVMVAVFSLSAQAADAAVSISIGEPGFYGRIDIGGAPPPEMIYSKPVVIQPAPGRPVGEPLYLHVPPGHEKNWKKHCREYNACGQPVYFVRDKWYNDIYVPHYRTHGKGHEMDRDDRRGRGPERDDRERGRGHDRDDHDRGR